MKLFSDFLCEMTQADKGIYTYRTLTPQSADRLYDWMIEHKIPNPMPKHKLHTTIIYSLNHFDQYTPDHNRVTILPKTYELGILGPAFVLKFREQKLTNQWFKAKQLGAIFTYPTHNAHISLTYKIPPHFDFSAIDPPDFALQFDKEEVDVFDASYAAT